MKSIPSTLALAGWLAVSAAAQTAAWEPICLDLNNVRGANYVPDYLDRAGRPSFYKGVTGPHAHWYFYDRTSAYNEVDQQLQNLKKGFGINALRVWMSFQNYLAGGVVGPSNGFIQKLDRFLSLCQTHRLRVMPVIWDKHGDDVALQLNDPLHLASDQRPLVTWTESPGTNLVANGLMQGTTDFYPFALAYLNDLITVAKKYPEVVFCWDVWNEPPIDGGSATSRAHVDMIKWTADTLRAQMATTHVTVGMTGWIPDNDHIVELANHPNITVLSGHPHAHLRPAFEAQIRFAAMCLTPSNWNNPVLSKPFLASELGGTGAGLNYAEALCYVRNLQRPGTTATGVGYFLWQAMIGVRERNANGQVIFQSGHRHSDGTGLLYPDGEVREPVACRKVRDEAILQGISPAELWADSNFKLKPTTDKYYYPLAPLPVGTNYNRWLQLVRPTRKYSDASFYLDSNGWFKPVVFEAMSMFDLYWMLNIAMHDRGPDPYRAFGLTPAETNLLLLSRTTLFYAPGPPATKLQHLENFRVLLEQHLGNAPGPDCAVPPLFLCRTQHH